MLAIADPQDPGKHLRTDDIFPVSEQSTARYKQKDCYDGQHGLRTAPGAQSSREGDSFAFWQSEGNCCGEGHAGLVTCKS
jgi:hypothetical protein